MHVRTVSAILAAAVIAGCGYPNADLKKAAARDEVALHFANLNTDAEQRKMDMKSPRPSIDVTPSTGRIYSDYVWSPDSVVITDIVCEFCKTHQIVALYVPEKNPEVRCPTCASPDREGKKAPPLLKANLTLEDLRKRAGEANVKVMWEIREGDNPDLPVKAVVRYVRRLWAFDPQGRIELPSEAAKAKGAPDLSPILTPSPYPESATYVDIDGRPVSEPVPGETPTWPAMGNYYFRGFHRLDSVYVGEMSIEFETSLKVTEAAKEQSVRPWNDPRTRTGPQRYETRATSTK